MTTREEWLAKARTASDDLRNLVRNYHPASGRADFSAEPVLHITAPTVERAAQVVRADIAREEAGRGDPADRFDAALAAGDAEGVASLLSSAWHGVPESTDCWSIRGFSAAVDLLDDPPEGDPNETRHSDGGTCCECGGAHECIDCPTFRDPA